MNIMPIRYKSMIDAVQGYQSTGMPLVASQNGHLYPAGFSDDMGIYYFIPKLIAGFGFSIDQAIDIFFTTIALLMYACAVAGLFRFFMQWNQRLVGLVVLSVLSIYAFKFGDVYIVSFFFTVATVPWILISIRYAAHSVSPFYIFPIVSFFVPIANIIRTHSGSGVALFMVVVLIAGTIKLRSKIIIFLFMFMAVLGPMLFFHHLIQQRNTYVKQHDPDVQTTQGTHPFWHSVYIGLGFIDNPYVEKYQDEVAAAKVKEVNPKAGYLSEEYSHILKQEILKIILKHPRVVIYNLAVKAGIIIFIFLIPLINISPIAAFFWKKPPGIEIAFWASLSFSMLFGLLVVPEPQYLLGFIAFAGLYFIASIAYGLEGRSIAMFIKDLSLKIYCAIIR
jgi:hypothetical protein